MNASDTFIQCELSGGPGCGLEIALPQQTAEVYLLPFPVPGRAVAKEVWSYAFANRCAESGAWVLEACCRVGYENFYQEDAQG